MTTPIKIELLFLIQMTQEVLQYILTCEDSAHALSLLPADLRGNKTIALAAVSRHGRSYRYVSDPLCYDMDVIKAALASNRAASFHIPMDLPPADFTEVLNTIIELNEHCCVPHVGLIPCGVETSSWWVAKCYYNTREVLNRIIPYCGRAIKYTEFIDDYELVTAAVTHDIRAYEFISPRLKKDTRILNLVLHSTMEWALPRMLKYFPSDVLSNGWVMDALMSALCNTRRYENADKLDLKVPIGHIYKKLPISRSVVIDIFSLILHEIIANPSTYYYTTTFFFY